MTEWWTYRLGDFLLFSPRVYWRLIELHNQAAWPLQILTLTTGAFILFALVHPRPWSSRTVAALLAGCWLYVGWDFLASRYATVNWAVSYVVPLFVLEALLLLGLGTIGKRLRPIPRWDIRARVGLILFFYALVGHPFVAVLAGRPRAAEVFGVCPDPTAIATLGALLILRSSPATRVLMIVPVLWCLISFVTLLALDAPSAWLLLTAAGLVLTTRLWSSGHSRGARQL